MQRILALPSPDLKWCDINGEPLSFVGPTVPPQLVVRDPSLANLAQLRFRNPDSFQASSLHNHVDFWENLISSTGYSCPQVSLLQIIREGVKVYDFFRPFKGNFKGRRYDSAVPPVSVFPNSPCCRQFYDFIDSTILDWVSQGVIKVHGLVGACSTPYLVLPLTVEPTKPRLCHDERFLNLWTRDLPFKLDHLPDLPRYVLPGHFQTTFDDKNGYQHLKIHPDSQEFFSFSWRGYYFSFCTLPFGWKASAFLYHNFGLVVTSAARSLGVPVSQYVDDRHVGQLFSSSLAVYQPCRQLALAAAFILLSLLVSAGYFINLAKSSPLPSTSVRFLGFISDSILQAFLVPLDKKDKFKALRQELLGSSSAPVKSLQRFAAKALLFSLAIPACKLYVREVFKAISTVAKNSKLVVPIRGPLRQELQEWALLDNWSGHLPWRSEHHLFVTLFTDASQRAWGAVLVRDGASQQIRDYWLDHERDINVLEARALYNALSSFFPSIRNARIDVWTDNVTLQAAWENGGCRNSLVNQEMKRVEEMSCAGNFVRTRLILCPWTATVAETGMEILCLTTRLSRPLILQEQMSSHNRYLGGITSTFFPLSSLSDRSCVISWINASVSLLPLLSLVYIRAAVGGQFFKLYRSILFSSEERAIRLFYSFLPAPPRISLLDLCHGIYGLFAVFPLNKLSLFPVL